MSFHLYDDGTLDTCVQCDKCKRVERYTWDHCSVECDNCGNGDSLDCYYDWLDWCLADVNLCHECDGNW